MKISSFNKRIHPIGKFNKKSKTYPKSSKKTSRNKYDVKPLLIGGLTGGIVSIAFYGLNLGCLIPSRLNQILYSPVILPNYFKLLNEAYDSVLQMAEPMKEFKLPFILKFDPFLPGTAEAAYTGDNIINLSLACPKKIKELKPILRHEMEHKRFAELRTHFKVHNPELYSQIVENSLIESIGQEEGEILYEVKYRFPFYHSANSVKEPYFINPPYLSTEEKIKFQEFVKHLFKTHKPGFGSSSKLTSSEKEYLSQMIQSFPNFMEQFSSREDAFQSAINYAQAQLVRREIVLSGAHIRATDNKIFFSGPLRADEQKEAIDSLKSYISTIEANFKVGTRLFLDAPLNEPEKLRAYQLDVDLANYLFCDEERSAFIASTKLQLADLETKINNLKFSNLSTMQKRLSLKKLQTRRETLQADLQMLDLGKTSIELLKKIRAAPKDTKILLKKNQLSKELASLNKLIQLSGGELVNPYFARKAHKISLELNQVDDLISQMLKTPDNQALIEDLGNVFYAMKELRPKCSRDLQVHLPSYLFDSFDEWKNFLASSSTEQELLWDNFDSVNKQ